MVVFAETAVAFGASSTARLGSAVVRAAATLFAVLAIGSPPVTVLPPIETTLVDKIGVLPPAVFFEPSCKGMISFREPLSSTM